MDNKPTPTCDALAFAPKMHRLANLFVQMHSLEKTKVAEELIYQNASYLRLLDEINLHNRKQTQAPNWA